MYAKIGRKKTSLDLISRLVFLVPMTGLEPVRSCPRGILSPLRLPFRHIGKEKRSFCQEPFLLEAPPGFEPGVKLLQSSALPLGYGAIPVERETGLEPAAFALARRRSTNWATPA